MIRILLTLVLLAASLSTSAKSSDIQRNMNTITIKICQADQPDDCREVLIQSNHFISTSLNFFMSGQYEKMRKYEDDISKNNFRKTLISEGTKVTYDRNIPDVWYVSKAS